MHPRSPFNTPTVFSDLVKLYPDLAKHVTYQSSLNFKDPEAVRTLSQCLLHHHFGLDVELRDDRLCPMIPNRLDYVLWIQDLLDQTGDLQPPKYDEQRQVVGLDIGTGASAIYPLLACKLRKSWTMIGTDIDEGSIDTARQSVARNFDAVGHRIKIHASSLNKPLIPLDDIGLASIDFVMCNPPFYSSIAEMLHLSEAKELPPSTACTGTFTEMVHQPDGEIGFARQMLSESLLLRSKVQWYTTLLGKLSSVKLLVDELIASFGRSGNWAVTQFVQGTTRRWAVGWSFDDRRPNLKTCTVPVSSLAGYNPFPSELKFHQLRCNPKIILQDTMKSLSTLHKDERDNPYEIYCLFSGNVWSRAWRRSSLRGVSTLDGRVRLGVLLTLRIDEEELIIRWVRGEDKVLFESFCEMIRRRMTP